MSRRDRFMDEEPVEVLEEEPVPAAAEPAPVAAKPVPEAPKAVDVDAFITRKLKVINEWPDGAKKRAAAERVLRFKEV